MKRIIAILIVAIACVGVSSTELAVAGALSLGFVTIEHQGGTLAIAASQISSAWYLPSEDDGQSKVRLVVSALGDARTIEGDAADALWQRFADGDLAEGFVTTPHQGGELAIPRDQIISAFFVVRDDTPRLRLIYTGNPAGLDVVGDDAEALWQRLSVGD